MINKMLLLIWLLAVAPFTLAVEKHPQPALYSYKGIFQAYWLPVWNEEGTTYHPEMIMRFFSFEGERNQWKVINIDVEESEKEYLTFIISNFSAIPEEFLKFKEGHIEQYGEITLTGLTSYIECDHRYYDAQLVSFTPQWGENLNIDNIESSSGCERYPYLVTYTLRSGSTLRYFKSEPSLLSENGEVIPVDRTVVKIRTINDDWIYAALFDAESPGLTGKSRGYLNKKDIIPVN